MCPLLPQFRQRNEENHGQNAKKSQIVHRLKRSFQPDPGEERGGHGFHGGNQSGLQGADEHRAFQIDGKAQHRADEHDGGNAGQCLRGVGTGDIPYAQQQPQCQTADEHSLGGDGDAAVFFDEPTGGGGVNHQCHRRRQPPEQSGRGEHQPRKAAVGCQQEDAEQCQYQPKKFAELGQPPGGDAGVNQQHGLTGVLHGSGGAGIGIENCLHVAVLHRHQSGNAEEHQLEGIPPVFPHTGDGLGALDGGHHQKNQTRNQQPHRGKPAGIDGSMAEQELPHRAGKAPADAGNEGVDGTPQGLIHGKSFFLDRIIESFCRGG